MTEEQLLVPLDQYLKAGIHIGTKFKTKYMAPFIYKSRSDGLSILNVQEINKRIKLASNLLSQYAPEEVLIVCRRENGWKPVKLFSKLTGIKCYAGRYPPGILTNQNLENFMEIKLVLITDPWVDINAMKDAHKVGIPIIALCDSNNESTFLDLIVPCNNKGKKSLGIIFWILTREYLKNRGLLKGDLKESIDDFSDE